MGPALLEEFRGLLESAPDPMLIVNQDGRIVLVNSRAEALFGYSREELRGQPIELLAPGRVAGGWWLVAGQDTESSSLPATSHQPPATRRELYGLCKDGREVPVEISLSTLEAEGQRYVISAVRDVTERKRFERDLLEKNLELEKANQARDRLLATMSHELRTPLNAILGFTGTLLLKLPGPLTSDQERQLRIVQASGRRLLALINSLYDLARIESGKVELNPELVDCQSVVREAAAALRPLAEVKGLDFEEVCPPGLLVWADRPALSQILLTLANNAIKFTERGGVRLEVVQRQAAGRTGTEFRVWDTGSGIRPEDQARLFQAFAQVEGLGKQYACGQAGVYEGTGLGLHLSRKLAELLGGTITLQSEFGKGSTFTLILVEKETR